MNIHIVAFPALRISSLLGHCSQWEVQYHGFSGNRPQRRQHLSDAACRSTCPYWNILYWYGPVQVHNLEGHDVKVSAQGPEVVSFQKAQSAEATHCVRLQTAGMYLVHVTVNGHPLSGWPKTLHVTASASEAARSASARPWPSILCFRPYAHCSRHTVLDNIHYRSCCRASLLQATWRQMLPSSPSI